MASAAARSLASSSALALAASSACAFATAAALASSAALASASSRRLVSSVAIASAAILSRASSSAFASAVTRSLTSSAALAWAAVLRVASSRGFGFSKCPEPGFFRSLGLSRRSDPVFLLSASPRLIRRLLRGFPLLPSLLRRRGGCRCRRIFRRLGPRQFLALSLRRRSAGLPRPWPPASGLGCHGLRTLPWLWLDHRLPVFRNPGSVAAS